MTSFNTYNIILLKGGNFVKFFTKYYSLIMLIFFIIYNIILTNLKITGILYKVIMILIIILNVLITIKYRKSIKYKGLICIIYFFIWIFSKNILQCYFAFFNIVVLLITGFIESKFIKIFSIFISIFISIFFLPLYFAFLLTFGTSLDEERERKDIYEDMHYYCEGNIEVYSYSAGAMDSFHYSIGKYYDILHIDGIINASYNERNEVSQVKYDKYLKNNHCVLVGDKNESK